MRSRPAIIVTAAGLGSRFGGTVHKLDQAFDGVTVLAATVRHAMSTQLPLVVVTTAGRAAALAGVLDGVLAERDVVVLSAAQAARGMGASIATGVFERPDAAGWLVLPGDMPLVQPATLLAVAGALEQHPVAYAQYRGRRGHPVAFAAELYSELMLLSGDDGARRVMLRYPAHGQDVEDPGVLLDIDTPADLETLRKAHAQVAKLKADNKAEGA